MERMNTKVVIPLERYEKLIVLETRINAAIERANEDEYISVEDLLRIIRTDAAIEAARTVRDRYRTRMGKWASESKSVIEVSECENMG